MQEQSNNSGAKLGVLEQKLASLREVAGNNPQVLTIANDMTFHTREYHQIYLLGAELIKMQAERLVQNKLSRHEEQKVIGNIQELSDMIINTVEEATSYMEGNEQMDGEEKVTTDIMDQKAHAT